MFEDLSQNPKTWLVTGFAGFIGSHLTETLLLLNQNVIGIDIDVKTKNVDEIKKNVGEKLWKNLFIVEDDLSFPSWMGLINGKQIDYILHQAAFGSVSKSMGMPELYLWNNCNAFNTIIEIARTREIPMVYASSSSVYGSNNSDHKIENNTGQVLSPYALTKKLNEEVAEIYNRLYGTKVIGLRYFNVYGPRQNPDGDYAALIPKTITNILHGEEVKIYGDGENRRDFTFIDNVVQANILAAITPKNNLWGNVYNVGCGYSYSVNKVVYNILEELNPMPKDAPKIKYCEPRKGDVKNSCADITKAKRSFNYEPSIHLKEGIKQTVKYFLTV